MDKATILELWAWRLCAFLSIAGIPQQLWKERALDELQPKLCPECQQKIRKEQNNDR